MTKPSDSLMLRQVFEPRCLLFCRPPGLVAALRDRALPPLDLAELPQNSLAAASSDGLAVGS